MVHQDHDRRVVGERAAGRDQLEPITLDIGLSVVGNPVALVRAHRMDEAPHDPQRYRAVATTGNVAQVQDQATRRAQLLERRVEGGDGCLLPD